MRRPNVDHARALRRGQTDAERELWSRLRNRALLGCKFRRQHEIGPYVVDFVCSDAWLVVELDGGQHLDHAHYDARRTRWLEQEGYRVLRFWNDDVLKNMDDVLEQIVRALPDTAPHPATLSLLRMPPAHPCAGPQPPEGGFDPLPGGERGKSAVAVASLPPSCGEKGAAASAPHPGGGRGKSAGAVASPPLPPGERAGVRGRLADARTGKP